jgi:acyl-CoA synthetase (AMP-forming)/AMP-acid ligase II
VRWDAALAIMPVPQILEQSAAKWPDKPALDFMGKKLTYRELDDLASRAAKGFQQLGVGPGIHVGIYLPNTPHYPITFFGVLKAGGTVVNYSPLDAEKVLEHKIGDSALPANRQAARQDAAEKAGRRQFAGDDAGARRGQGASRSGQAIGGRPCRRQARRLSGPCGQRRPVSATSDR